MPAETPDYLRIVTDIRRQITDGTLQPGDVLPTKRELAVTYGVSTSTMDRVVVVLRETGWIRTWQGKEMRVAETPPTAGGRSA